MFALPGIFSLVKGLVAGFAGPVFQHLDVASVQNAAMFDHAVDKDQESYRARLSGPSVRCA